jgi:hypothetical protein
MKRIDGILNLIGSPNTAIYTYNLLEPRYKRITTSLVILLLALITGGSILYFDIKVSATALLQTGTETNVALNKSVTYSNQQVGNEASHINDGNTTNRWSASPYPQWIQLDLGYTHTISKSELVPYNGRAYQYYVEVSVNGTEYTKLIDRTSNTTEGTIITDTFNPTPARYVKLTITDCYNYDGGWASISELRVFGHALVSSPTPTGKVISEDFSSCGNMQVVAGGIWNCKDGKYTLTTPSSASVGNGNMAVHNTSIDGDFTLTVDGIAISSTSNWDDFSILFGFVNSANYYFASFNESNDTNTNGIFKVKDGAPIEIVNFSALTESGTVLQPIRIEKVGSNIKVYRANSLLGTAIISGTIKGKVGVGTRNNSAVFDNLVVAGSVSGPTPTPSPQTPMPTPTPTATPVHSPTPSPNEDIPQPLRVINVSSSSQLTSAISSSQPGDHIVLADGSYSISKVTGKSGTANNPIVIKAANPLKATISNGQLELSSCAYMIFSGLRWTTGSTIKLTGSHHCRLTRSYFNLVQSSSGHWILIQGEEASHHNRIDHNTFEGKSQAGNYISFYGSSKMSTYDRIDHNYFRDNGPRVANEKEAIRVGWSQISMSSGYTTIEYNLFENIDGDPEIISVKSCDNVIRYNTFRTSLGVVCARHGNRNSFYGNFFLGGQRTGVFDGKVIGTGGIRLYGQDQKVYNNYFEGLTGTGYDASLQIDGGDVDKSGSLNAHWRVYRAIVVNNTFVNNSYGIEIGKNYSLAPVDSVLANNIVVGTSGSLFTQFKAPVNMLYQGNIAWPTGSATVGISKAVNEIKIVNPSLVRVGELMKLSSISPVINYSMGSYSFVVEDMDGQERNIIDAGADEYSTSIIVRTPLSASDVGPSAR